jgi:16S rRNA (guanine527-N7)-methyltransferase
LDRADLQRSVLEGAAQLQLDVSEATALQLADYLLLLHKWNRNINLTAVRELPDMVTHHLLDCLAIVQPLRLLTGGQAMQIVDVGTGAGLPGLVLAATCPELQVLCIDSVEKKVAFVQQAIGVMHLSNAQTTATRVESLTQQFDVVTCRAFASISEIITLAGHLVKEGGFVAAMKGPKLEKETAEMPLGWQVAETIVLAVPGLGEERSLAIIKRMKT